MPMVVASTYVRVKVLLVEVEVGRKGVETRRRGGRVRDRDAPRTSAYR